MSVSDYSILNLYKLYEETGKQLKKSCWPRVAARVKKQNITTKFTGINKDGSVRFVTKSGTTPGKYWNQTLIFKDLTEGLSMLYDDPHLTQKAIMQLVVAGDLILYCDDPSFKYYWSYKAHVGGYGIMREIRYPKIRNPKLTGSVCKHLYAVLSVLPFYTNQIVAEYKKMGILDPNWEKQRKRLLKK